MKPSTRLLGLCCILLASAWLSEACTSGGYLDPKLGYMSWRLYDQPASYFNSWAFVPPGMRMSLLPVAGRKYSSLGTSTRVKNGFVCLSPTQNVIEALIAATDPGVRMNTDTWAGGCLEGYNTKGLHVSTLMQLASTGINSYSGTGPAVEQVDLPAYVLANYDTVASVVADLLTGAINPVMNPNFELITKIMFGTNYSTVHYNIRDNSGRAVVIEYSGRDNLQWHDSGANTPYQGAMANNPLWQQQIDYYNNWWATQNDPYITIHNSQFVNLAGSFDSSHRFLRAAKLPQAGYDWEWPKTAEISPYYTPEGAPDSNPAVIAAMNILQSVYLPKGIDDAGGQQYPGGNKKRDIVWVGTIADHRHNMYYWRVAASPQWKRFCMADVDWRSMGGTIRHLKLRATKWWVDETNSFPKSRWEENRSHQEPEFTLQALRADIKALKAGLLPTAAVEEADVPAAGAVSGADVDAVETTNP